MYVTGIGATFAPILSIKFNSHQSNYLCATFRDFIHSSIHKINIFDVLECALDTGESGASKTEAILPERSAEYLRALPWANVLSRIITECHRACFLGELNPTLPKNSQILRSWISSLLTGMRGTHICQHLLGTVSFQMLCWWFSVSS